MARKGPVVRHTKVTDETRASRKILKCFIDQVEKRMHDMVVKGAINGVDLCINENIEIKGEALLAIRKKLLSTVKTGMEARRNLEPEIAIYAAIVWFMRQEKTRRDQILSEWGAY